MVHPLELVGCINAPSSAKNKQQRMHLIRNDN